MTRTALPHLSDENLILDTDSYKSSHFLQYPPAPHGCSRTWNRAAGAIRSPAFSGCNTFWTVI